MTAVMPLTGQVYRHVKTGNFYRVIIADARIEATNTEAVVYRREDIEVGTVWVRPRSEFTDGRFEFAGISRAAEPGHEWVPSTLGHGSRMCKKCHITDLEAVAVGMMNRCENA